VVRLYRSLGRADHYELLGVERDADRKALKRAYFELASKLHPDRYFRKKLGSFKLRMEAIFSRMTQAHDTLGNPQKRQEYDAYLDEQRRSRGIEELLEDALAEVRRAEARAEKEATEAAAAETAASAFTGAAPAPAAAPALPRPPSVPPVVVEVAMSARRDALARRLLGGRSPSSPSGVRQPIAASGSRPSSPPASPSRPAAGDAMAMLRRRYEERKTLAKATQARAYVAKGQEALAAGDAVSAANSFRVAVSLKPDDPELERVAREAQAKAEELLASTYERQAAYEEKNGQWIEAARSWARVCRARPEDKNAHDRAANAIVKAGGDLHEAGRLAQRACALDPNNVEHRVTLANVYLAAGLTLNARRELETAANFAPQDGTIQAMLKRVGKSA
jgi:curved DNA-binding protein CbpA